MVHLWLLLALSCAQTPAGVGRIDPPGGPTGTIVTITGSGFSSTMTLELGGQTITDFEIIDERTMHFQTPQLPPGEHSLVLTRPNGATTTIPRAFATDTKPP